jgi:hypothetical protein
MFDGLLKQIGVYHNFNKCSFKCHTNTFLILCKYSCMRLLINSSYHACILFVLISLLHIITSPLWIVTSYNYTSLVLLMWTSIDDLGIHLLQCSCGNEHITTYDILGNIVTTIVFESGTHVQRKVSHIQ